MKDKQHDKPVWITRDEVDVAVVISPELFYELIEAQEELEDIATVEAATQDKSPNIPWERVQRNLELGPHAPTFKKKVARFILRKRIN